MDGSRVAQKNGSAQSSLPVRHLTLVPRGHTGGHPGTAGFPAQDVVRPAYQINPICAQFAERVRSSGTVWLLHDDAGVLVSALGGERAVPFWSSRALAEKASESDLLGRSLSAIDVSLADWISKWLVKLEFQGAVVGLDWLTTHTNGLNYHPAAVKHFATQHAVALV
ncbi:DUF2750 domain-containing protein [Subtercola frigoramans]|uniref:DUF2750 domain-containing protein n=1 Tax=Subtercola frigoramans TaxID=120298 RepID=A0ABS2L303_9MICO|nr:DUF2750 domain-containing protein [Subtercola frigoramans]MBM7471479.1 hypothetical protein [Subtercola frigoramans]